MNSPTIAGLHTRKSIANVTGYNDNKLLREYFKIDWAYNINTTEALQDYGTKAEAFKAWKRGFKGTN